MTKAATTTEQLERTILELGAEIYRMKNQLDDVLKHHENFRSTVKGLKEILDEKGLILSEDFDAAIDLGNALSTESLTRTSDQDLDKLKKTSH